MSVILIRPHAGVDVGTGHVMRGVALAEALFHSGLTPRFLLAATPKPLVARVTAAGFQVHCASHPGGSAADLQWVLESMVSSNANALVLDGYCFDSNFRCALRRRDTPVLAFDDLAEGNPLFADIIVNPSPAATPAQYQSTTPEAQLLLGPAYAPIRHDILAWRERERAPLELRDRLLLTLGGSDPMGLTEPLLLALAANLPKKCRLTVVVGGSNPRAAAIEALARPFAPSVEVAVDSPSYAEIIATAGLAVTAGGGTVGELACLGIPMVMVIVADNQAPAAVEAARTRDAVVIDARAKDATQTIADAALHLWSSPAHRLDLSRRSAKRVDGRGTARIAEAVRNLLVCREQLPQ